MPRNIKIYGNIKITNDTSFGTLLDPYDRSGNASTVYSEDGWSHQNRAYNGRDFRVTSNVNTLLPFDRDDENAVAWGSGVLAPTGKIYMFSENARHPYIMKIDPSTDQVDSKFISTGSDRYFTGTVGHNGKIYAAPYANTDHVLVIDPLTDTTSKISVPENVRNMGGSSISAPNGNIYMLPFTGNANTVLTINNTTIDTPFTLPNDPGRSGAYCSGAALALNGKIYVITLFGVEIHVINTITNSYESTIPTGQPTNSRYRGAVLAPNGNIYFMPQSNNNNVIVLDPNTETVSTVAVGNRGWSGAVLGMDGKIYGVPRSIKSVLILDPSDNSFKLLNVTNKSFAPNNYWQGGVLAPNGKIYMGPFKESNVLVMSTTLPTIPPWMLAPEFNCY